MQGVLRFMHHLMMLKLLPVYNICSSLVIDTVNDHNTSDTARRVAKMFVTETFSGRYLVLTPLGHYSILRSSWVTLHRSLLKLHRFQTWATNRCELPMCCSAHHSFVAAQLCHGSHQCSLHMRTSLPKHCGQVLGGCCTRHRGNNMLSSQSGSTVVLTPCFLRSGYWPFQVQPNSAPHLSASTDPGRNDLPNCRCSSRDSQDPSHVSKLCVTSSAIASGFLLLFKFILSEANTCHFPLFSQSRCC
jgi:hypothetical protein